LMIIMTVFFVMMSILDGQKLVCYLVHILPFYAALLAIWIDWCWERRRVPRWMIATCVCGLLLLQRGGVVKRSLLDSYHKSYLPAVSFLKSNMKPVSLVMGSAELGFELGFNDRLIDDRYLGYYSGKRPDFIVVEEAYEDAFNGSQKHRPAIYQHITDVMKNEYREVYNHASYRIYARDKGLWIDRPATMR
jgi:hypothetical protein